MRLFGFRRPPSRFSTRHRESRPFPWSAFALWGIPVLLITLSGLLIASTQRQAGYAEWINHWITGALGLLAAFVVSRLQLHRFSSLQVAVPRSRSLWTQALQGGLLRLLTLPNILYGATIAALLLVKVAGTSALGAQRWIAIGSFQVQPSEFAKLAAILLVASVLARFPVERPVDLLRPFGVMAVPWALVFIQPDLGTSLVFGAVLLATLYWSGMPAAWLILLLSPLPSVLLYGLYRAGVWSGLQSLQWLWILIMAIVAWQSLPWRWAGAFCTSAILLASSRLGIWLWEHGLKSYQRDRLTLFLDPSLDPMGGGYHLLQSMIGIGSGGLFGIGLMQGHLTRLQFIPEQHTDFIFSALGEELGLLGCVLVVLGFTAWAWQLLRIAAQARSTFESLLVIGILAMVMFQVTVNIFMTTGLGPITGIPLPFMSYGRSALLTNCLGVGLVAAVQRRTRQLRASHR